MFIIKKILLSISRNKVRSFSLVTFSFLVVFIVGVYFENLRQNQHLLNALGAKIPVTVAVTNANGDRLTGLDITEKRIELFLELGLKKCVITAESYGNIGTSIENTEKRVSVHLMGTNTISSMDAWKPEFSMTQRQMEENLSSEQGVCILNENYMQERGVSWQVGDVIDINLYRALYDEFDSIDRFVEITSSNLRIVGFYQVAPESGLEAADIICPLKWLAKQYQQANSQLVYSSAKGIVEHPLLLNELKIKAGKLKFPQVDIWSAGGRPGNALVIDDRVFIQTASQLKDSIRLLKLFMIPLILLLITISAMVYFFAACYRKQEIYLERCMGRKRFQIVAELVGENIVLSLMGSVIALPLVVKKIGIFSLAVFLGIQIMATLMSAIWLSLKNPMKIFL